MRYSSNLQRVLLADALIALQSEASPAAGTSIERTDVAGSSFPISLAVSVPANTRITFFAATSADVADPDAPPGSHAAYGDTHQQTVSILRKMEKLLATEGLTLADVVKVNVFLAGDPRLDGKMDFDGMDAAYGQFFGSASQPNKPVRTALQVVALPMAGSLVQIDVTAAKVAAAPASQK